MYNWLIRDINFNKPPKSSSCVGCLTAERGLSETFEAGLSASSTSASCCSACGDCGLSSAIEPRALPAAEGGLFDPPDLADTGLDAGLPEAGLEGCFAEPGREPVVEF